MSRARSRSASNSGSRSTACRRRSEKPTFSLAERILQVGIGERGVDIVLEVARGRLHQRSLPASPIGGEAAHVGQHLGDVPHLHRRCPRAAACPPCSSGSRDRRPAACRRRMAAMSADFSPTMAFEISGYFTQKVPPKPQQTSGVFISRRREALHRAEQAARLLLDAELAQARAGIVIGDGAVVARGDLGHAQHVDQEGHQLVAARRPGSRPAPSSPDRRRTGRDSDATACRRRSPTARPRLRSLRTPRSPARRSPGWWRGRRNCRPAVRSIPAGAAPRRCSRHPRAASPPRSRRTAGTGRRGR